MVKSDLKVTVSLTWWFNWVYLPLIKIKYFFRGLINPNGSVDTEAIQRVFSKAIKFKRSNG